MDRALCNLSEFGSDVKQTLLFFASLKVGENNQNLRTFFLKLSSHSGLSFCFNVFIQQVSFNHIQKYVNFII